MYICEICKICEYTVEMAWNKWQDMKMKWARMLTLNAYYDHQTNIPVVSASSYPPPPTTSAYRWNSRWRGKKNQSLNTYKLSALLLIKKIPQERGRFSYFIQLQHWQCKRHLFFVSVRLFYGLTPIFWHTSNKRHKSGHFAFIMIAVPRNGYTFASKTRTERDKRQY